MEHERVIIRDVLGDLHVRRVWDFDKRTAWIATDAMIERMRRRDKATYAIGFPRADVFMYNEAVAQSLDSVSAQDLKLWRPQEN